MAPGASFQVANGGAFPMANFPRQDGAAAASAPAAVSPAIVGAGVGAGVLILAIIIAVVVRIQIVRKHHRRTMAELERGLAASPSRQMEMSRPTSAERHGSLMPIHGQAGWDALYSNDSVNEPEHAARPDKRQRTSVSTPQRLPPSKRFKKFRHLSAIMENTESSRIDSRMPTPPSPQAIAKADTLMGSPKMMIGQAQTADHAIEAMDITDAYYQRHSPNLDVLPSFAIDSPSRYRAAIVSNENNRNRQTKAPRSVSAGVLDTDGAVFGNTDRIIRNPKQRELPATHARSVSHGAPTSRPPSGPVPPLPTIPPQAFTDDELARMGVCVTRESSESSMNSAGSSVLVARPVLKMRDQRMPSASPIVEQVVAEDDRAELRSAPNRQWQNPYIFGARPNTNQPNLRRDRSRVSVKSSTRCESENASSHRMSMSSTSSGCTQAENRLSVPQIATADKVSISRISSSNSLIQGSAGRVQKIETPPRTKSHRQSSVSASGSPAARDKRRSSALRDMSSNITGPIRRPSARRQLSISTLRSSCSSNGNPFQWDTYSSNVLAKPSAMKGSPDARKSKGRLSCVRISTLTPEVFGRRSTSSSPAAGIVMDEILEERESEEIKREVEKERAEVERAVAHERRRSRSPMLPRNVSTDSCLRIQTLRASLTPSSPTLSLWNAYQEQSVQNTGGLASLSPVRFRNSSRMSNRSSGHLIIPRFPSPSKVRASVAVTIPQLDTAMVPEFSIDVDIESPTLGFNDLNSSSPFGLADSSRAEHSPVSPADSASGSSPIEFSPVSPVDMPSSPPLALLKEKEYDPGWCPVVVDFTSSNEYDPASPPFIWNGFSSDYPDPDRSSGIWLPFAVNQDGEEISPRIRMPRHTASKLRREQENSPTPSPKTVPTSTSALTLTSSNASSLMPSALESTSSFLGTAVPVLAPPAQDQDTTLPQWQLQPRPATAPQSASSPHRRNRSVSNLRTPRPSTARAPPLATIPQSSSPASPLAAVPAPLNTLGSQKTVPQGPRPAPAKSVLKNATALRRMNSEVQTSVSTHRESRNFVRLDREPSLLLPWIGTETEDVSDYDIRGGADAEFSPAVSSSEDSDEEQRQQRKSVLGVPQVDITSADEDENRQSDRITASALDELSFDELRKVIENALAGFDTEHQRYSSSALPQPSQAPSSNTNERCTINRTSSVWDEGEKFWTCRPESLQLPQFQHVAYATSGSHTPRKSPLAMALECEEEGDGSGTVDPRLLMSTPTPGVAIQQATPRSLYDSDGFFRG